MWARRNFVVSVKQVQQLAGVIKPLTAARSRVHIAKRNSTMPAFLLEDLQTEVAALKERVAWLEQCALTFIKEHPAMFEKYELIVSIPGIATRGAVYLLGELWMLPEGMDVRQWVAHAGLDPRVYSSGTVSQQGLSNQSDRQHQHPPSPLYARAGRYPA